MTAGTGTSPLPSLPKALPWLPPPSGPGPGRPLPLPGLACQRRANRLGLSLDAY